MLAHDDPPYQASGPTAGCTDKFDHHCRGAATRGKTDAYQASDGERVPSTTTHTRTVPGGLDQMQRELVVDDVT